MQAVSESARALVLNYAKVTLSVYIDDNLLDVGIGAFEYLPSCGAVAGFSFGNACAAGITISLDAARADLKNHAISVKWSVDDTEYPLFSGKVEKAKVSAGRTYVEAWDAMYFGGSETFDSETGASILADVAFRMVAGAIGVPVENSSIALLSDISIGGLSALKDTSNSAVAGYIAGLVGGNAVITRSGELAVRQFARVDFATEPYEGGAEAENEDYAVTGVTLLRESYAKSQNDDGTSSDEIFTETFVAGTGLLSVDNPLADQLAAERAYVALSGLRFRPGSYTFPGGLLLEPGDVFEVVSRDGTYYVAGVTLTMTFDGGVKTSVSCGGEPESGGSVGTINQALKTLQADVAQLRTLVAENATIISAKITNLSVEDLKAGRIRSTDFAVSLLPQIYPDPALYPGAELYPNNGEEIVQGIEIDFASGIIRGVFFNSVTDTLRQEVDEMKSTISKLEARLAVLEQS